MLSEKIPLASAAQLMMLMLFAVRSKKRSRRAFLDAPAWLQSEDSWIPVRWETCPSTEKNVLRLRLGFWVFHLASSDALVTTSFLLLVCPSY